MTARPKALSPACMKLLESREISVEQANEHRSVANLYDWDGEYLFSVSEDIKQNDLHTMLNLFTNRFDAGMRAGRAAAFADLRALIGAAES